jgi:hypothetical protein
MASEWSESGKEVIRRTDLTAIRLCVWGAMSRFCGAGRGMDLLYAAAKAGRVAAAA